MNDFKTVLLLFVKMTISQGYISKWYLYSDKKRKK